MVKVLFKVDVTNEKQEISKDHGVIPAGSEIEYTEIPERIHQLSEIGAVEIQEEIQEPAPKKASTKKAAAKK